MRDTYQAIGVFLVHIVIEGPDNAGKSTLVASINASLPLPRIVVHSEGREKYTGEMDERAARYLAMAQEMIFDRHPCISQQLYNKIHPNREVAPVLIGQFYAQQPLLIYCRANVSRGMEGHIDKDHDQQEYLELISKNYPHLCRVYDEWAIDHAHIFYRIGDNTQRICQMVRGAL